MTSRRLLAQAVEALSQVEGMAMDSADLAEDVIRLVQAWEGQDDGEAGMLQAVDSTVRALRQLVAGAVEGAPLVGDMGGWCSYHYQYWRVRGQRADMRIIYRRSSDGIQVLAFGNRHRPSDIYRHAAHNRSGQDD